MQATCAISNQEAHSYKEYEPCCAQHLSYQTAVMSSQPRITPHCALVVHVQELYVYVGSCNQ